MVTTLLTIYALLGEDIRLAATSIRSDPTFDTLTVVSIVIFGLDCILSCIGKRGYFLGFFFYLDFAATVTLIFDISTIGRSLFGSKIEIVDETADGASGGPNQGALRASRASRAGSKAGRIIRIVRVVRLIRLIKLMKVAEEVKAKKARKEAAKLQPGQEFDFDDSDSEDEDEDTKGAPAPGESRVGRKLSDMTTRRVIILVLIMLFMLPLFSPSWWYQEIQMSNQYGTDDVFRAWIGQPFPESDPHLSQTFNISASEYERKLLQFIYTHNPHRDYEECMEMYPDDTKFCPGPQATLVWIGSAHPLDSEGEINPTYGTNVRAAPWVIEDENGEKVPNRTHWHYVFNNPVDDYVRGDLPDYAQDRLVKPWTNGCYPHARYLTEVALVDCPECESSESRQLCPEDLRSPQERADFYPTVINNTALKNNQAWHPSFAFSFDRREWSQRESLMNIFQTFFIVIVLGFGAMAFSRDANVLVLQPIERMSEKVMKIRNNPLSAINMGEEEFRREQKAKDAKRRQQDRILQSGNRSSAAVGMNGRASVMYMSHATQHSKSFMKWMKSWCKICTPKQKTNTEPMETVVLEKTITKLGGLLVLGFGQAGAEIISSNMRGSDAHVNVMVPGRHVEAIFGYCSIRDFAEATEILQHRVMVFVNQVGEIVHGITDEYHGAPNKNIGDAFLMIWRLNHGGVYDIKKVTRLADLSVMAFVKIVYALNSSEMLSEYRSHPGFLQRFRDYRVSMGFGLHSGWAIEGATGSEFKIDASYLSPNVNTSVQLESATDLYGTEILVSQNLMNLCSREVRKECRLIDYVTIGSKMSMKIYTIDLHWRDVDVEGASQMLHLARADPIQDRFTNKFVNGGTLEAVDQRVEHPKFFTARMRFRFKQLRDV